MLRVIKNLVVEKIGVVLAASKKECKGEPFISCIIDLWSQRNAKWSFVNMNSQVISDTKKLQALNLCSDFKEFAARKHDAKAIMKYLRDTCNFWDFNGKVDVALWTPDGEAAGKKAFRSLGWKIWVCDCHQINRAVLYGIGIAGPKHGSLNPDGKILVENSRT